MKLQKTTLSKTIALFFACSLAMPSLAALNIVPENSFSKQGEAETQTFKELKNINADFENIPLSIVADSIVPDGWSVTYSGDEGDLEVSWSGNDAPWYDIFKFILEDNNLQSEIDFHAHRIDVKGIKKVNTTTISSADDFTQKQMSNDAKAKVDSVIDCNDDKCENKVINIEKLVLDTSWIDAVPVQDEVVKPEEKDIATKTIEQVAQNEDEFEQELLKKQQLKEQAMKTDYKKSFILHGDGSFESFVNNGGYIRENNADPEKSYTYIYKKGSLFTTINAWAAANGYTVKNEILEAKKDYPNIADAYLQGNFYDVTTTLLDKYKNAKVPVNHRYFEKSKTLYIFSNKYINN